MLSPGSKAQTLGRYHHSWTFTGTSCRNLTWMMLINGNNLTTALKDSKEQVKQDHISTGAGRTLITGPSFIWCFRVSGQRTD